VAREGVPFVLASSSLCLLLFLAGLESLGAFFAVITLFTAFFFRDPERHFPEFPGAVITPADGKILGITSLTESESPLQGPCAKVSIFMSIFDVHVNRIPLPGTIKQVEYKSGNFFSANLDKSSHLNERNLLWLEAEGVGDILVVQIAGLIARRICCWVSEGDRVYKGQRFGLIRFGSRVDLFLPEGFSPAVAPGDKVKAGKTILGFYHEKQEKETK